MNLTLRVLGVAVLSLTTDEADDTGPGVSADVTLAPGFVPEVPWYDDED
jgi:hypothetical protein